MAAQKQRLLDQKAVIEFIHEADEVNEWINTKAHNLCHDNRQ